MGFQSFSLPRPRPDTVELEEGRQQLAVSSMARSERELINQVRSLSGMGIGRRSMALGPCQLSRRVVKAGIDRSRHSLSLALPTFSEHYHVRFDRASELRAPTLTTAGLFHVEPRTTCRTCSWRCGDSNCMTGKPISLALSFFFINCSFTSIHLLSLKEI